MTRSARFCARRRAASGSAVLASAGSAASLPFFSARSRRPRSHSSAQPGASPSATAGTARSSAAQSSSSPSACLHGNLRLGQLHLYPSPPVSTTVWYGLLPLPLHRPHTLELSQPLSDHGPAAPSLLPALRDESSGARASTCSAVQRTPC
ncbi:hypothetical protein A8W25_18625 [Streptomyces sp. ERV7]|nr:hypothetical protein A8W25_18625 [Streptomyces sp. ERV7]